jgi:hypothetical protein
MIACGAETLPPDPAEPKSYRVTYRASAGSYREVILATSPQEALTYARRRAENPDWDASDLEPDSDQCCICAICIDDDDTEGCATWADPSFAAEKYSTEILDFLEALIEAVDDMTGARADLDEAIGSVESCAQTASHELKRLGVQGGVQ